MPCPSLLPFSGGEKVAGRRPQTDHSMASDWHFGMQTSAQKSAYVCTLLSRVASHVAAFRRSLDQGPGRDVSLYFADAQCVGRSPRVPFLQWFPRSRNVE